LVIHAEKIGKVNYRLDLLLLPSIRKKIQNVLVIGSENQGVLVETFKGAILLKVTNSAGYFWEELQTRYGQLAYASFRATQMAIINNSMSSFFFNKNTRGLSPRQ